MFSCPKSFLLPPICYGNCICGDDVYFELTINTDGIVPKGHEQQELWPIYVRPSNLPQHYKYLHESVALISVVADSGKPSDFAWAIALTPFIDWLRDQGNGLSLNISPTKQGVCHLFHFASWASSSQACMLCKVKPIYEHRAQRWGIIDEFTRRNNLNILFDMLHRQGGFKEGATFWMNLVNVLNYRFDNLHKICEGVCSTILKEFYGDAKKWGML
uniref:Uncharacterized protein n=1 Tax=Panagrolaimus davidi TaxID=227884 RepID=A0A914PHP3_9BILA